MFDQASVESGACVPPGRTTRMEPPSKAPPVAGFGGISGAASSFTRNEEIYGENEPAAYFYKIVRGAVRTYKVLMDGRRQITAFYLPGDVFGLETGEAYTCSAEATVDAKIVVMKRSMLVSLAAQDHDVARQLWMQSGRELQRSHNHVLLLIKTAPERVAAFLLEMAERVQSRGEVELPMSRQDIADYLGLTIETVSRMLTRFENENAIFLPSTKRIVMRDPDVLRRMNA